jgi:hypothetical protein
MAQLLLAQRSQNEQPTEPAGAKLIAHRVDPADIPSTG